MHGWHNGYTDVNDERFVEEIAAKKPDLVFVGIGFPKQEYWISNHMSRFEKGLFMGIGGSFDVWAGDVKRAPLIWQNLHLEWLYRLIKQPTLEKNVSTSSFCFKGDERTFKKIIRRLTYESFTFKCWK